MKGNPELHRKFNENLVRGKPPLVQADFFLLSWLIFLL